MWYRFGKTIIAKTRDEYLREIDTSEDIIAFLNQPEVAPHLRAYLTAINKNPAITLAELKNLPVKNLNKNPELETALEKFKSQYFASKNVSFPEDAPFDKWIALQAKKNILDCLAKKELILYDFSLTQIYDALDFYRNTINDPNAPRLNIFNHTWEDIHERSEEWHRVISGEGSEKMFYEPIKKENIVYTYNEPKGWTIQKVISANDLAVEGEKMHHCVKSYESHVKNGWSRIFSLRDEKNKPRATMEFLGEKGNVINQIKAFGNEEPDKNIKQIIGQWLQTLPNVELLGS